MKKPPTHLNNPHVIVPSVEVRLVVYIVDNVLLNGHRLRCWHSLPDSELDSLKEVNDDILHEKLLNINLLIAKIESLNDNPTPDCVLKSPSPFPIPVEDSDSFFEKSDTSLSYSDNSLPEFKTFSDHTEDTSSGSTTTHSDNSLPDFFSNSELRNKMFDPGDILEVQSSGFLSQFCRDFGDSRAVVCVHRLLDLHPSHAFIWGIQIPSGESKVNTDTGLDI
ncbi:hypothetical protein Tco_0473931 [Tanacetum coccineum]